MSDDDPEWVQGVDFRSVNPLLQDLDYPVTADEIVTQHGDHEIDRTNADPITIEELFDYMGDETFESEDGLRQQLLAQMPSGSTGRENYSDRGGSTPVQTEEAEEAAEENAADVEEGTATDPDTKQQ